MTSLDAAKEFGLAGDGSDSTAGFVRMLDAMRAEPLRPWELVLPPGHYVTGQALSSPARQMRLVGYGATLQAAPNRALFIGGEPFRDMVPRGDGTHQTVKHAGYRIATTAQGALSVTLLDDPAGLVPGAAMIGGLVQQTRNNNLPLDQRFSQGYPPNLRWFEWVDVLSVADGVAQLGFPLAFEYRAEWHDYPNTDAWSGLVGAPRIYCCARTGWTLPELVELEGLTFLRSQGHDPASPSQGNSSFQLSCRELIVKRCTRHGSFFVQMADLIRLENCKTLPSGASTGSLEIDKCIRRIEIDGCQFAGEVASRGAGAMEVSVKRSRIGGTLQINAREVYERDQATIAFGPEGIPTTHGGYFPGPHRAAVSAGRV